VPSGRKRGGQLGHRGAFRTLLPVEQVDEVVRVVPQACRHCEQPLPETAARRWARAWRHQVVELLPLAVRVTEYQMGVRGCADCGKRTRADLPAGVPRPPFGARLTAVIALLSGQYRLRRREVRQLRRRGQANPDHKAAALCRELTKWWAALWTFARVEGVEPTNNVAEGALRPAVVWRKGSFGSDSGAGSRFAERLLTVVASCRQQGRPLLAFLVAAGEAALRGSPPPTLLSAPKGS
jgi:transposase